VRCRSSAAAPRPADFGTARPSLHGRYGSVGGRPRRGAGARLAVEARVEICDANRDTDWASGLADAVLQKMRRRIRPAPSTGSSTPRLSLAQNDFGSGASKLI